MKSPGVQALSGYRSNADLPLGSATHVIEIELAQASTNATYPS
ncbi:MAG TPA: hypothetical protein V6C65_37110 [Allocoleopsis sp.]